ncbi:hybrid sensor histidine kinase/response regulator [Streptosporangium jomthongense]|uniref:histidine kinase n=1 Tax=Marinobacter aromaticivorans TaxID=1494078 RepID=A0ABW2J036_9GAMM|nr:NahK/ErcS family hybrid sensor histidine kinase/response regulator [Marinobacter aromaticivorans]GGE78243.1 hybrid sensor histidine kinase/response regulator [Streptosporangium jomthongense]
MKKPFDRAGVYDVRDLLGLGSQSGRKNYYPALQERIEELEREKNRYKWLFENALHGIFQGDLRGGFLGCNPAMARICGYPGPKEIQTRVIRLREQLFCSANEFDTLRQELLDKGSIRARETRLCRADNTAVYVAITLLRRPDLGPEVVEAFVADISERVQAQQKLVQINADLERRVEERTRALQDANAGLHFQIAQREKVERELVIAAKAAEDANRSKDKYLAAASHDLLQPLNAARLVISALQDSALPAEEARMVAQVHRALEGAEDLLADLLDISKLDQQAMVPDMVMTDIAALVRSLGEEFEAVAANAGVELRVRTVPAMAQTDQRMLTRILRNLLSNAFRYTPRGCVLLALRARNESLRIEVWDTGVGIEESKLQDIFTEFHQLLPQGTGGRQGAGLGLAIVERMVSVLGYKMDVVSRPGRGSRFSIQLPAGRLTARRAGLPDAPVRLGLAGTQVLVIDNEPAVLESMKLLLECWGCSVIASPDEQMAVEYLKQTDVLPAAVLADYHLDNERTGLQAIDAIRKLLGKPLPAALVTANCSDELRKQMRAQDLPILNKPVKPNRLRALLTSLLSAS